MGFYCLHQHCMKTAVTSWMKWKVNLIEWKNWKLGRKWKNFINKVAERKLKWMEIRKKVTKTWHSENYASVFVSSVLCDTTPRKHQYWLSDRIYSILAKGMNKLDTCFFKSVYKFAVFCLLFSVHHHRVAGVLWRCFRLLCWQFWIVL